MLMTWRAESRARHQRRPVSEILRDVAETTEGLRKAPQLDLNDPRYAAHTEDHDWSSSVCDGCAHDPLWIADMRREPPWPELPEAAARAGIGYISGPLVGPDGRRKITCSGSPEQVRAFMLGFGEDLVDLYGDPARGFAGGYEA